MINIPLCYLKERLPEIFSSGNKEMIDKISKWGIEANFISNQHGDCDFISFLPSFNRIDLNFLNYLIEEIEKIFSFENIISNQKEEFNKLKIIPFIEKEIFSLNDNLSNYNFILFNNDILNVVFEDNSLLFLIRETLRKNNISLIDNFFDIINFLILETGRGVKIFFSEGNNLEIKELTIEFDNLFSPLMKLKNNNLHFIYGNSFNFFKKIDLENILFKKYFFLFFDNSLFGKNIKNNISNILILDRFIYILTKISNFKFVNNSLFIHQFNNLNNKDSSVYFSKKKISRKKIDISLKYIEKKLGISLNFIEMESILNKLSFSWIRIKDIFCIKIPLNRFDLNYPEDILGELSKIFYLENVDNFINHHINENFIENKGNYSINGFYFSPYEEKKIISFLSNTGWSELLTYSLINNQEFSMIDSNNKDFFLINPKNKTHEFYRNSMIYSHLKIIDYNLNRGNNNLFFFEISSLFDNKYLNKDSFYKLGNKYLFLSSIGEIFQNSSLFCKKKIDLFWMKGILENIFDIFNIYDFSISSFSFDYLDKGFKIFLEDEIEIGFLGILKRNIYNEYKSLSNNLNREIIVMQLNLNLLKKKNDNLIKTPSLYPSTYRDVSLIFFSEEKINYKNIVKKIEKFLSHYNILERIEIFDIYQNNEMKNKNEESISFRIVFRDYFCTLDGEKIDSIMKEIIEYIKTNYFVKLR